MQSHRPLIRTWFCTKRAGPNGNSSLPFLQRQMLPQGLEIELRVAAQEEVLLPDAADAHDAVHRQGLRHDVVAVEAGIDDAGADSEAVEADQKVKESGPVPDLDVLRKVQHADELLRKIEGIPLSLLENQVGIGLQHFRANAFFSAAWVMFSHSDTVTK